MRRSMHPRGVPRVIKMGDAPPHRKRARAHPQTLDPLFLLPLTSADTVRVGKERVWAPGLLVYMSLHGTAWDGVTDLGADHWNAAQDNLAQFADEHATRGVSLRLLKSFVSETAPTMHGAAGMQLEPRQVFWLGLLDKLHAHLLKLVHIQEESRTEDVAEVLAIIHSGIQFLCVHNPVLATTLLASEEERLTECVRTDAFWRFNPVQLVAVILWTQMFRDAVLELLEAYAPSLQDAGFVAHSLPCPFLPLVAESEVADPADALAVVSSHGMPSLVSQDGDTAHESEGQFETDEFVALERVGTTGLLGIDFLSVNFESLLAAANFGDGRL